MSETPDTQSRSEEAHLRENELAAFLDDGLTGEERHRVEAHIDVCDACRAELVDIGRAVAGRRSLGSAAAPIARRWWVPAAVAAGLVAVLFVPRYVTRPRIEAEPHPVRVIGGEELPHIELVSPLEDASAPAAGLVFTWHAAKADVYRFSLLTQTGDSIWSNRTTDTAIALPAGVTLQAGAAYFWRVDAVANGIVATTGVHHLRIAR